jgi:hypothetical protein
MILESIVTSRNPDGSPHIAPLGLHVAGPLLVIAPFRPSRTLDNLARERCAAANWTTDVRLFAGPVTGRRDWPVVPTERIAGVRLRDALTHAELEVVAIEDDPQRPRFRCRIVHEVQHAPFRGLVRAQAAVVEAAILATRLQRLPPDKVESELAYLQIAIDKTAGPVEREAWGWLMESFTHWRNRG